MHKTVMSRKLVQGCYLVCRMLFFFDCCGNSCLVNLCYKFCWTMLDVIQCTKPWWLQCLFKFVTLFVISCASTSVSWECSGVTSLLSPVLLAASSLKVLESRVVYALQKKVRSKNNSNISIINHYKWLLSRLTRSIT